MSSNNQRAKIFGAIDDEFEFEFERTTTTTR